MNPQSRSTALDVAKLSAICMEDKRFARIVATRYYVILKKPDVNNNKRTYRWENTNKLLDQPGVSGIKTGITNNAGPCLATAISPDDNCQLIIVLLACKNVESRWSETLKLAKWTRKRLS